MGDHDERAPERLEELLEPGDRLQVEVVRRLVEQEEIGRPQQHPGEQDAHAPAAGEVLERLAEPGRRDPEPGEDRPRPGLHLLATLNLPAVPQLAVRRGEGGSLRVVRGEPCQSLLGRGDLRLEAEELGRPLEDRSQDLVALDLLHLLREVGDSQALGAQDRPVVGLVQAGEHPQNRGLADPVRSDERQARAGLDPPAQPGEQEVLPELSLDALELDQHTRPPPPVLFNHSRPGSEVRFARRVGANSGNER